MVKPLEDEVTSHVLVPSLTVNEWSYVSVAPIRTVRKQRKTILFPLFTSFCHEHYPVIYSDEKSGTWDILQCRQTVRIQGHTSPFIHNYWLLDVPPGFIFKNSEDVSVCCGWISEHRLLPYTALTTWFLYPRQMCLLRGTNGIFKHNSDFQQAV